MGFGNFSKSIGMDVSHLFALSKTNFIFTIEF